MNAVITTEQRFLAYDGGVYAEALGDSSFWSRYLEVFDSVEIVARIQPVDLLPTSAVRADGDPRISFLHLSYYVGPLQGIARIPALSRKLRQIAQKDAAFILRIPGAIGTLLYPWLRLRGQPYGVEVVGDPADSLSPGALQKKWGYLFRPLGVFQMAVQCRNAAGAAYVTRETLQQRYPSPNYSTHYSSIELSPELLDFARDERARATGGRGMFERETNRLIFVGSLSQRYKGLHVLLEAMKTCLEQGVSLELQVLGDGQYRPEYEALAASLGVQGYVRFSGYVKQGKDVLKEMCAADLFVMPSLMEGLPRAMIEAMACGLPCIGSRIGGIPELLPEPYLCPPNEPGALAQKIIEVVDDPVQMREMGNRNREVAVDYRSDLLRQRRQQFYQHIRSLTHAYLNGTSRQ
jgi:glycosyltransferase involved in cell wall biosynthesis